MSAMLYFADDKQALFWTYDQHDRLFRTYLELGTFEIAKLELALQADAREEAVRAAFLVRVLVFGLWMLVRDRPITEVERLSMRALRRQCDDALAPFLGAGTTRELYWQDDTSHTAGPDNPEIPWVAIRIVLWRVLDTFDSAERPGPD
ncbi:MAG: hypothetical protein KIT31_16255 [Deltaproteobacteria bacterium]|nr:hypothetical protein [Deltaproteobacteria bacterium]